jgi:hypothetical protein
MNADAPTRSEFFLLGEVLGFPPIRSDGAEISWREFTERSTPPQRAELVAAAASWYSGSPMLATAAARERVKRWIADGAPVASYKDIARRLTFVGDVEIEHAVLSALERVPPPVSHHVLNHTVVFGSGWATIGFHATPRLPTPAHEPLSIVVITGACRDYEEVEALVGHEFAHAWLTQPPDALEELESTRERAARDEHLVEMAVGHGRVDLLARLRARDEAQAAALAKSWGFDGAASNPETCAAQAQALVRHDAERLGG